MKIIVLIMLISIFSSAPLFADKVYLKDGNIIKGKVIKGDKAIDIFLRYGSMKISKDKILRIEKEKLPQEVYEEKLKLLKEGNSDAQYLLALWCKRNDLLEISRFHLLQAIRLNPNHKMAREMLGFIKKDNRWLTKEQVLLQKGFVKYKGRWITKKEKERIIAEEKREREKRKYLLKRKKEKKRLKKIFRRFQRQKYPQDVYINTGDDSDNSSYFTYYNPHRCYYPYEYYYPYYNPYRYYHPYGDYRYYYQPHYPPVYYTSGSTYRTTYTTLYGGTNFISSYRSNLKINASLKDFTGTFSVYTSGGYPFSYLDIRGHGWYRNKDSTLSFSQK